MTSVGKRKVKTVRRSHKTAKLDLDGQLAQLENAELVRRLLEGELAYLFKHTLTQETAYESLLLKKRREIHQQVAEQYERFYPDRLDEFSPLLAKHYGEAGDDSKTLIYELRAGDVAARRYANAEAYTAYSHALQLAMKIGNGVESPVQDLYLKRGRVLELSGKYDDALTNYAEMEGTARAQGDRAMELASWMARATLLATPTPVHDQKLARKVLEQALVLARELGDYRAEAKGLWNLMILSKFSWHPNEAGSFGLESLAIARKFNLREQMAYTLNDLVVHFFMDTGEYKEGLKSLEEAKQLWRELDNQPMLADSLSNSALTYSLIGDFDAAIQASQEARRIAERIGNLWGQSYSRFVEGDIHLERGDFGLAKRTMEECIALGKEAGFVVPSVWVRSNLAYLHGLVGRVETGVELARHAAKSAGSRIPVWRGWPLAILARLELMRGRIQEAKEALDEAKIGEQENHPQNLLPQMGTAIALASAELAIAQGDPVKAETVLDKLIARFKQTGGRGLLPEPLFLKAIAGLAANRIDDASETLSEARAAAEALGSRRMLWRILTAQAKLAEQRGEFEMSKLLLSQAREKLGFIVEHIPTELRASFLDQPEVREMNLSESLV